jgi:hypothetical protein
MDKNPAYPSICISDDMGNLKPFTRFEDEILRTCKKEKIDYSDTEILVHSYLSLRNTKDYPRESIPAIEEMIKRTGINLDAVLKLHDYVADLLPSDDPDQKAENCNKITAATVGILRKLKDGEITDETYDKISSLHSRFLDCLRNPIENEEAFETLIKEIADIRI